MVGAGARLETDEGARARDRRSNQALMQDTSRSVGGPDGAREAVPSGLPYVERHVEEEGVCSQHVLWS